MKMDADTGISKRKPIRRANPLEIVLSRGTTRGPVVSQPYGTVRARKLKRYRALKAIPGVLKAIIYAVRNRTCSPAAFHPPPQNLHFCDFHPVKAGDCHPLKRSKPRIN